MGWKHVKDLKKKLGISRFWKKIDKTSGDTTGEHEIPK